MIEAKAAAKVYLERLHKEEVESAERALKRRKKLERLLGSKANDKEEGNDEAEEEEETRGTGARYRV